MFNGTDRLGGKSLEPGGTVYEPGHRYAVATQEERDHIPIVPPSPTRLLARVGPLSGERLGLEILVGLLLGIPALLWGVRGGEPSDRGDASEDGETRADVRPRMRRAAAAGLGVWMLAGIVLFSDMVRLHPRYVEGFTPAVAAMLGIGIAWVASGCATDQRSSDLQSASRSASGHLALLVGTLAITVYYAERLLYGRPWQWWVALAAALGAIALAVLARRRGVSSRLRSVMAPAGVMAMTLVAVLAILLRADFTAIADRVSDAGLVGELPGAQQRPLSAYLLAHQDGARFEVAAESATAVGSLIVQDGRPILVLTTYDARVFTSVSKLKRLIAEGQVRYAFLNTFCTPVAASQNPACSEPAQWVRAHGTDVSREAGLPQGQGCCTCSPGRPRERRLRPQPAAGAGRRRPRGGQARARHRVHGRGPLPHAAVPGAARDPRSPGHGRAHCDRGPPRRGSGRLCAGGGSRGP